MKRAPVIIQRAGTRRTPSLFRETPAPRGQNSTAGWQAPPAPPPMAEGWAGRVALAIFALIALNVALASMRGLV